ncbi:MAG TPA: fibronectin type III domain-containing protein, partial [Myxococcaceae bacterium]|nr:fibronectin type III domain-containing protein [Myxococcaceae bacterium]
SLDLAQLPGTVEAGAAVQFELSARDAFGNVAPGYTGTVRFSSDDGTAELPADYTFIAADQGRHVFPGLTLKRAGARRVEVVDTANAVPGATREVGVVAGPPAKLAFTLQPSNRSVRVPFEVAVQLRDAFDNRVAAGEPAVTLSVFESGVTLDGPLSVALVDGEASFSGLSLSQQGTFTLKASAGAVEGTSDTFIITDDVAPATPVLSQGAITTTRIPLQWTAPGDDGALGTASSYDLRYATAPIVTDADFAAALPVLISAPQVAGSAESVTLEGLTPGTTYYVALAVTDDAGNSVRSASLPVSTQDVLATSLLFTRQPQSGTAGTALPLIEVSILDQEGNVLTSSNAAVSLAVQGVGGFGPFSVAAVNGVASFDAVRIDTAGTGYRLVATSGALDAVQSDAFDVAPAEAASFEVSGVPSPVTAHSSLSPVVTAKDAFGNVVTGYTGTVHFSSDDPDAVLPGDYTFTPADLGQHAFTDALVLKTVGARTVSVADTTVPALTGTLAVTVEAAVASQLVLSGLPASVVAGETHSVTVEARDAQGNVATSYRGTVQFTSTDAAFVPPAPYTFTGADAGSKTFSVQLLTAGAQGLTVTDDSAPTPLSTTANTTVQPAAAAMLVLSAPATGTASSPFTLTVTATDAHGNVAKGYTGTVHFSSSDALATLPADYTFTGADEGSRQFSITPRQAGNSTFSVEDAGNGLPVANASVTVSPGPAVAFTLVPSQNPVDAGGSFSLQVTARDQDDNVVTGYTGTVRFASGDAAAQLPADYTFLAADNGTHSFSVVLKTAGTHALTVAEHPSGTPSASIDLQVQPGPAGRLEFRAQPANGTVRAALPEVVVAITDDHGNVIATDSTAVTVALVGGNPAASLGGTKTASPVDGLARFSDLSVDQEGTGFQLQATGGALAQASSSAFEIVDDLAPAAVSLSVSSKSSSQVTLSWTAVGDDGLLGTAAEYELRYATSDIVDDASFAAATRQLVAAPQAPGSPESATITALTPSTTYYFALKTLDGAGNAGPLVSLSATTDADP